MNFNLRFSCMNHFNILQKKWIQIFVKLLLLPSSDYHDQWLILIGHHINSTFLLNFFIYFGITDRHFNFLSNFVILNSLYQIHSNNLNASLSNKWNKTFLYHTRLGVINMGWNKVTWCINNYYWYRSEWGVEIMIRVRKAMSNSNLNS